MPILGTKVEITATVLKGKKGVVHKKHDTLSSYWIIKLDKSGSEIAFPRGQFREILEDVKV